MFFEDDQLGSLKRKAELRRPPPIPETGWRPPAYFPNLSNAKVIAFDTETREPDFDRGPGWGRGKGHIIGFSVAAIDGDGNRGAWYFPVRHEVEPEYNLDPSACFRWLKMVLETPHIPKVGANLIYDIGWLTTENIYVEGELHDVQFAEALLKEDGFVGLDYLGKKYVADGKDTDTLYQWLAEAYGGSANGDQRANLYRAPARLVGPYAEQDADLPLRVLDKQWPILHQEGLGDVYRMECDLIYLMVRMRLTGVNIDVPKAEQLYVGLGLEVDQLYAQFNQLAGFAANVNSAGDLAKILGGAGLHFPQTATGKPSFRKEWLEANADLHPAIALILDIRAHEKIRDTFIKGYLLEGNVNGRVHCNFHPLRGDSGGTRSGRFSSDCPNLQNIPVRSKMGKRVRECFIADDGHIAWEKNDYSQIEYRFLAHFAVGPGADDVRARYNSDPRTDYHVMTQLLVKEKSGREIERKPIKNINFGLLYGMGEPKLARQIGVERAVASEIFKAYHVGNPYVKATMQQAIDEAQELGFITTIMNRRSRFEMWEPTTIDYENRAIPMRYQQALRQWGSRIKRAHTHKAINRRLQGSAADMIKKGMHQCYREGVFDVIGVPKLQVHDELDFSVIDNSPAQVEAYRYMRHVLENALPLRIPVLVDSGRGPNWGAVE